MSEGHRPACGTPVFPWCVPRAPHRPAPYESNCGQTRWIAALQHRGLFRIFYPGSMFREHLGLAGPAGQFAVAGA